MAQLTFRRASQYAGKLVGYSILVDGETVARIGDGKILTVEVAQGHHEILVKAGFAESNSVQVEVVPEGEYQFELGVRETAWAALLPPAGFGLNMLIERLRFLAIPLHVTLLFGPLLAAIAYLLYIGKRRLYLREVSRHGVSESGNAPGRDQLRAPGPGFRLSVRSLMLLVAFLAVLFAIDVEIARRTSRRRFARKVLHCKQMAAQYRRRQRNCEETAVNFDKLADASRAVSNQAMATEAAGLAAYAASNRTMATQSAAVAAYYEELGRKYTRAASERRLFVEPDPPEPPDPHFSGAGANKPGGRLAGPPGQ